MDLVIEKPHDLKNNRLLLSDRSFHDWYRFVLSFPAHLVRQYFDRFCLSKGSVILDPFCGTGTTLVEAKKHSITSFGIEAGTMAAFASKVKTNWVEKSAELNTQTREVLEKAEAKYSKSDAKLLNLTPDQEKIILGNSICKLPLHKCLLLLEEIRKVIDPDVRNILLLALAHISVYTASNLRFGPEVGVSRRKKEDANVFEEFFIKCRSMADDLASVCTENRNIQSMVVASDSRCINGVIPQGMIDAVITSPPYPNEKDYTRTTRLESVLLGLINNRKDLRHLKQNMLRSNTRNVYVADTDDNLIRSGSRIDKIAEEIERRRVALGKTSGFERLYHRVTRLYFGGLKRHLLELQRYLKPGAKLAYVVGNQASYLQVMIRTGELLAEISDEIGYDVIDLELFRTRTSTTTGEQLREEVLILEWKGNRKGKAVKKTKNRYDKLIERVFFDNYTEGALEVTFVRDEFESIAKELGIRLPKNLGDIVYSYRYRNNLPSNITSLLEPGEEWIIRSTGRGKYKFAKSVVHRIAPNPRLTKIKILDATPEIIRRYALNDEQALLAILRYNRLIDTFLGITCYPLQSHLRTTVPELGQVETDEIYVGVSNMGTQYVIPVEAKGKKEELGIIQVEQDFAICASKFPALTCRPVAAQFMQDDLIALFEFEINEGEVSIKEEKHYRIVPNEELSDSEIKRYRQK